MYMVSVGTAMTSRHARPKIGGVTLPICVVIKLEWAVINLSCAVLKVNLKND